MANYSSLNQTAEAERYTVGLPHLLLLLFIAIGVPLNATVCIILLRNRHLFANHFYIYILNLEICFQMQIILGTPVFLYVSGYKRFPSGDRLCTFFLYIVYVLDPCEVFCQLLITGNRLWAMVFPDSYHHNHTRRRAVLLCILGYFTAHLVLLPVVLVRDVLGPSIASQNYTCKLNVPDNKAVETAVHVTGVLFLLLEMSVVLMYPLTFYKYRQNKRLVSPAERSSAGSRAPKRQSSGVFWTLTLCTIFYACFMLPAAFYLAVGSLSRKFSTEIFAVLYLFCCLQSIIDPVIFMTTLRGLRQACWQTIRAYCGS